MLKAGIPHTTPATAVNKVCSSGLKAVMMAADSIRSGMTDVMVAGGMESMSNVPHYVSKSRTGTRLGDGVLVDGLIKDGELGSVHVGGATARVLVACRVCVGGGRRGIRVGDKSLSRHLACATCPRTSLRPS